MLIELAEFCHFVTRAQARAAAALDDAAISETERRRGGEIAEKLRLGPLTRAWQILLKGVEDVKDLPRPLASAEMAIIRLAFAADLPSARGRVAQARRRTRESSPRLAPVIACRASAAAEPNAGALGRGRRRLGAAARRPRPSPRRRDGAAPRAFEDVVALARAKRDIHLCQALERDVRLARFEPGRIEFSLVEGASPARRAGACRAGSRNGPGERWMVALAAGRDRADAARNAQTRARRSGSAASRRILSCARCSNASPAPKSSTCAGRSPPPIRSPPAPDDDDRLCRCVRRRTTNSSQCRNAKWSTSWA